MASPSSSNNQPSTTEEQDCLTDSFQKTNSSSSSDLDKSNTNTNMSDENRDPSTTSLSSTKFRPKPVDARSAAAAAGSSLISCSSLDSPKSATITNVSQRLPSTSVEVSVGEIFSTGEKRASVSIREQQQQQQGQHRHSSSSCSSSDFDETNEQTFSTRNKMDLGEATRELTRLLHIGNENTNNEIHLNPDAPDFTPIDFSPTYRSEFAPAHLNRRLTHADYYNNRRSRYYSESYNHSVPPSTSTIRPLLSLIPQYIPHHRQSWTTTTPGNSSSNNSWWQQEYSNPSSTSSYHSKAAYPLYSPLMPPLTDDSLYPGRHSSKRQRVQSNRAFVFPSPHSLNRKRSHSGPETPLQAPPTHLNGIHSLAKIMIDILRMIDPLPVEEKNPLQTPSVSSSSSPFPSQQRKYRRPSNQRRLHQQHSKNESIDVEDVFVDDEIATISSRVMNDEHMTTSKSVNDNKEKEGLISTTDMSTDESFYEVPTHDESSSPTKMAY